ncbi:MAG: nucleotidyltransferase domain-containing protein, partial [Halobacteriota archaeon]|nr:nucleotidyltransferase domain-containing protein [Halobacteriota archaeon]
MIGKINEKFGTKKNLLLGSRARGDNLESSDFDMLIASENFENNYFREIIIRVYELLVDPPNVEVWCYTSSEFEEGKEGLCI